MNPIHLTQLMQCPVIADSVATAISQVQDANFWGILRNIKCYGRY